MTSSSRHQEKCLFCLNDQVKTPQKSLKVIVNGEQVTIKTEPESCTLNVFQSETPEVLAKQLQSIFIVRKLLDISEEKCAEYLRSNGGKLSPDSWFSLCLPCQTLVTDCYRLQLEIVRIQRQFEKRKCELKELIYESDRGTRKRGRPDKRIGAKIRLEVCQREENQLETTTTPVLGNGLELKIDSLPKRQRRSQKVAQVNNDVAKEETEVFNSSQQSLSSNLVDFINTTVRVCDFQPLSPASNQNDRCSNSDNSESNWCPPQRQRPSRKRQKNVKTKSRKCAKKGETIDVEAFLSSCDGDTLALVHPSSPADDDFYADPPSPASSSPDDGDDDDDDWLPSSLHQASEPKEQKSNDLTATSTTTTSKSVEKVEVEDTSALGYRTFASKHRNIRYECCDCPAVTVIKQSMMEHRKLHETGEGETCPYCGLICIKRVLSTHIWRKHPEMSKNKNTRKAYRPRNKDKDGRLTNRNYVTKEGNHKKIPFYCDHCQMIYTRETDLVRHANVNHASEPMQKCDVCQLDYFTKQQLKIHLKQEHSNSMENLEEDVKVTPEECPHCSKMFPSLEARDFHIAKEHVDALLTCKICGKGFPLYCRLKRHYLSHREDKMMKEEKYREWRELVEARRNRNGKVLKPRPRGRYPNRKIMNHPYRRSKYYNHILKKDAAIPFYCDHCYMIYPFEIGVVRHCRLYHAQEPLCRCETCGLEAYSKQLLKLHKEIEHPDPNQPSDKKEVEEETSSCPHCQQEFSSVLRRDFHIAVAHTDILRTCKECGYKAPKESILHKHVRLKHSTVNRPTKSKKKKIIKVKRSDPKNKEGGPNILIRNYVSDEKNEEEIPFYCDHCQMIYTKETDLIRHADWYHASEPMQKCTICQLDYFTKQQLQIHFKLEHPEQNLESEKDVKVTPEECPHCSNKFPSLQARDFHMAKEHAESLLSCKTCGKGFSNYARLKRHFRSCKEENVAKKLKEEENYREWRELVEARRNRNRVLKPRQRRRNTGANKNKKIMKQPYRSKYYSYVLKKDAAIPFYCDHCHMIYPFEAALFRHCRLYHAQEPLCRCETCGAELYSKQLLKLHKEINHPNPNPGPNEPSTSTSIDDQKEEKACLCPHCQKEFPSVIRRDFHIAIAHVDILRTCQQCGYKASKESQLHDHIRMRHSTVNHYQCDLCTRSFKDRYMLDYHRKGDHHEELGLEPFKCKYCGSTFGSRISLRDHEKYTHEKVKEVFCEYCGKGFSRKCDLNRHILLHTAPRERQYKQGPFFCEFCNAKFNVRQGLYYHLKKLHSDKFLYRCKKCSKGYCFQNTLYQHERTCKGGSVG